LRTRFSTLGRAALLAGALLIASAAAGVGSASAAWINVAVWNMNETAGATTMTDSSGKGRDGIIGDQVTTHVQDGGLTGYQFQDGPKDIERLVLVNRAALNPYKSPFSVFLRFKTNVTDQNIIQKGQANTAGGSWKIEMVDGHVVCTFRGAAGRGATSSRKPLADNAWHTVRCIRRPTEVVIVVGTGIPRVDPGRTGNIENRAEVTIGGKKACTAPNVSCQYYTGLVDRVVVRRRR
jgi:Laminin G domain